MGRLLEAAKGASKKRGRWGSFSRGGSTTTTKPKPKSGSTAKNQSAYKRDLAKAKAAGQTKKGSPYHLRQLKNDSRFTTRSGPVKDPRNEKRSMGKPTGSTARTRAVTNTARKVAKRRGTAVNAKARAKARQIVKKRG